MDKLDRIFQMQAAFNAEIAETRGLEHVTDDEWLQKFALATYVEIGEMLSGTNFKWWKNPKPADAEYIKEEIVDVLHFFVSMALSAGMDADELYRRYCAKNQENFDRQHGKSDKPGYDIHEL
jgi:dimeric dUTPase (all-alpha-NTP-PPase superfamily)